MKTYVKDLTPEEIIKRLKNGEVVKIKDSKEYFKMIDGVICRFFSYGDVGIGSLLYTEPDDVYFETEELFEIKETGLYKTRCGRKVFVSDISLNPDRTYKISGIIEGDKLSSNWTVYGNAVESGDYESTDDIISKWEANND